MSFYRRNLPHWQPIGAEYFVTFRLAGSLPREIITELKEAKKQLDSKVNQENADSVQRTQLRGIIQKRIFQKYESVLERGEFGPTWLNRSEIAEIVMDSIHYRDEKDFELYAYCIMSNHVHLVFKHLCDSSIGEQSKNYFPITEILESLKKFTARRCNKILNRTGSSFWQPESYDHIIRESEELERVIHYTLSNPVKANLVDDWQDWPHSYCKPEFSDTF